MNKKSIILIIFSLILLLSICLVLFCVVSMPNSVPSKLKGSEELLLTSVSPDGEYTIEVYRTEPGATVDFSIKAYLIDDEGKTLIYNAYHESEANVVWLTNSKICINEKILDLSNDETYDWRKELYV